MNRPREGSFVINTRTGEIAVMDDWLPRGGQYAQVKLPVQRYERWLKSETQIVSKPASHPAASLSKL